MTTQSLSQLLTIQVPANPFPGLRPFEFHESDLFFGRDGQSEDLIAKLIPAHFIAVIGASGSGKSSLVRAGVLPALLSGFTPGTGSDWLIALMRPGHEPIANLARALNAPDVFGSEDRQSIPLQIALTEMALYRGSRGLIEAVHQANLAINENLLIVVDQFEELFRYAREHKSDAVENEADAFVKLLLSARAQRELNIFIVLTMRSDFLGDCARFMDLPEAINESQYLIPRLTREQLREAITGPASIAGGEISQSLVNRLLNDIGENQDQLPILQHALMRTWSEWRPPQHNHQLDHRPYDDRPVDRMNLCCYDAVGGWRKTLSRHAEEALSELTPRQMQIAEKMFKLLTEKDRDNRDIRRLTKMKEICGVAQANLGEVADVIDIFRTAGRSFLTGPVTTELSENSLIDISHESLIRNWDTLRKWVREEAASAKEYRRLAETAYRFQGQKDELINGYGLQTALDWKKKQSPTPEWAERYFKDLPMVLNFLELSQKKQEAKSAKEKNERQEKIKRAKREVRRVRIFAILLAILTLLGIISTVLAWRLKFEADRKSEEAQHQKLIAEKQTGVANTRARKGYVANIILARNLYVEQKYMKVVEILNSSLPNPELTADKNSEVDLRGFEWYYLWHLVHDEYRTLRGHTDDVIAVTFFNNGKNLASGGRDKRIFIWNTFDGKQIKTLEGHTDEILTIAASLNGKLLASGGKDKNVIIWDSISGKLKKVLSGSRGEIRSITFSPNGNLIASGGSDGKILIWSTRTFALKYSIQAHNKSINSVSFSNNDVIASGSEDKSIKFWSVTDDNYHETGVLNENDKVRAISFSPDSSTFASVNYKKEIIIRNPIFHYILTKRVGHKELIRSIKYSNDGRIIASSSDDGTVKIWNADDLAEIRTLKGHSSTVNSIAFSPDNKIVATASNDSTIKLWSLDKRQPYTILNGKNKGVMSLAFSGDGEILASGGNDNRILIWNAKSWRIKDPLIGHYAPVRSLSFSPNSSLLASGSEDKTVRLWNLRNNSEPETMTGHRKQVLAVTFSGDGKHVASGSMDKTVRIWGVKEKRELKVLQTNSVVHSVEFSPDRHYRVLASAGEDANVYLWDTDNWQKINKGDDRQARSNLHPRAIWSLTFSRLDKNIIMLTGSDDESVNIIDVKSGMVLKTLSGHGRGIRSVVASPDYKTVASSGFDSRIILWDVNLGIELISLTKHKAPVWALAFSPDGKYLASGSKDGMIIIWPAATEQEVEAQRNR